MLDRNITNFHNQQKPTDYTINNQGVKTALIWKRIQSVGLYIPAGKAVYPSSVIMNVIPAKVAGVERITVVTPSKLDLIDPYILAILDEYCFRFFKSNMSLFSSCLIS